MPFQNSFDFRLPARLIHGPGSIARLPEVVGSEAKQLIVTDRGLVEAGIVDQATAILDSAGIPYCVFDGVGANPLAKNAHAGARQYIKEDCRGVIAVGGGSPMDVAKMIGILATNDGRIESYLGAGKVGADLPPLICVPTTYGTGSEVTQFSVLTNPKTNNKDPIISWKIVPLVGILDADLSVSLPASVGGPTGMDALTHAIESYTNLLATPITDGIAISAIELIGASIRTACANDYETEATQDMLIASAMAGIAFSQTRLGNVHAMSHPVGAQFGVHHGLANAILLPYVMEYNLSARLEKFISIAQALGEDVDGLSDSEAGELAVEQVRQLNHDLGIPPRLRDVGVRVSGIPKLARAAINSGNIAVNPRKTTQKDIEQLFRNAV